MTINLSRSVAAGMAAVGVALGLFAFFPTVRAQAPAPPSAPTAGERPNILWIVSEDNAAQWLGCYGNKEAKTPRLDALAREGTLFERAYANAPVCAVSRCTLLTGAYAASLGTTGMRSRHPIPSQFKPYVTYLREQGYYCTNNAKTDYNFQGRDASYWDASSNQAHYKNRPSGKPFFAVFNIGISHESNLFPRVVHTNRQSGAIPLTPRLNPATLTLPPYVPDLPEVRSDWATYADTVTAMDKRVGELLDELDKSGQADNTIVFYYSDHGGPTPRGKRYLEDTGVRVPLLVRVPPKWQSLSPFAAGQRSREIVSFVDFAPTLLSLSGLPKPQQMQGRAFVGTQRVAPKADPTVFLFADRFDEIFGMRRALTDGRYKYTRSFMPYLPSAPYSLYPLQMPSWAAWQKAFQENKLAGYHKAVWEAPTLTEALFDTESDPWEMKNLAHDPAQANRLKAMRERLRATMTDEHDASVIPEPMFAELTQGKTSIYAYVRQPTFPFAQALDLAFVASARDPKNLPQLTAALKASHPVLRYWGATGCVALGKDAAPARAALTALQSDASPTNRITAAYALARMGSPDDGVTQIARELEKANDPYVAQLAANILTQLNGLDRLSPAWVERIVSDENADTYLKRLANRVKNKGKVDAADNESPEK